MLTGAFPFLLSEELLAEYREVLLRPTIARRHGLTEAEVDKVLEGVVLNAAFRESVAEPPQTERASADEDDVDDHRQVTPPGNEHIVALLSAVPEAVLVTGDRRLAQAVAPWCTVATPAEFATAVEL